MSQFFRDIQAGPGDQQSAAHEDHLREQGFDHVRQQESDDPRRNGGDDNHQPQTSCGILVDLQALRFLQVLQGPEELLDEIHDVTPVHHEDRRQRAHVEHRRKEQDVVFVHVQKNLVKNHLRFWV